MSLLPKNILSSRWDSRTQEGNVIQATVYEKIKFPFLFLLFLLQMHSFLAWHNLHEVQTLQLRAGL